MQRGQGTALLYNANVHLKGEKFLILGTFSVTKTTRWQHFDKIQLTLWLLIFVRGFKPPVLMAVLCAICHSHGSALGLLHQSFVRILRHEYEKADDERHQRRAEEPQPP